MIEIEQHAKVPEVESFIKGLPWVIMILIFGFLSWLVWEDFFTLFMNSTWAQYASLGMGPQGALAITYLAMGGNRPFHKLQNKWIRGICLTVLALVITALFWLIVGGLFKINLEVWAFPIIATSWFFAALTSFIGADAHLQGESDIRRTVLNILIMVAGTLLVLRTIVWIPPFWFGLVEAIIVTGGFSYCFRGLKQPLFSFLSWSLLILLTFVLISLAIWLGFWNLAPGTGNNWLWNIGSPSGAFGVWFALTGGFNFALLACTQCWPFSRIRQPWATPIAVVSVFALNALIAGGIIGAMRSMMPPGTADWQAAIMAWQTVVWGWAWVYFFGIGQQPYLWAGQKKSRELG